MSQIDTLTDSLTTIAPQFAVKEPGRGQVQVTYKEVPVILIRMDQEEPTMQVLHPSANADLANKLGYAIREAGKFMRGYPEALFPVATEITLNGILEANPVSFVASALVQASDGMEAPVMVGGRTGGIRALINNLSEHADMIINNSVDG